MSWSGWGSRLNVTSFVSQGLEQVSKLREDVEKQFDQVVTGVNVAHLRAGSASASAGSSEGASAPVDGSQDVQSASQPSVKVHGSSVDDIGVSPPLSAFGKDVLANLRLQQQPPASADGKRRVGGIHAVDTGSPAAAIPPRAVSGEQSSLLDEEKAAAPATALTHGRQEGEAALIGASARAPLGRGDDEDGASGEVERLSIESRSAAKDSAGTDEQPPDESAESVGLEEDELSVVQGRQIACAEEVAEITTMEESMSVAGGTHRPTGGAVVSGSVVSATEVASGEDSELSNDVEAKDEGEDENEDEGNGEDEEEEEEEENEEEEEEEEEAEAEAEEEEAEEEEEEGDNIKQLDGDTCANSSKEDTTSIENTQGGDSCTLEAADVDLAVVKALRRELQLREAQLLATSSTIAELHNELDKTCQREVAAVERARNLSDQIERMRSEMEQQASSAPRPSQLQALQYELEEKDAQLKALLEEGNALSVKQSQYEQRLRVLRKEKDEEEERRLKFQTQSETLSAQLQDVSGKLKATEEASKRVAKEMQELQLNSQNTAKKLSKAEQDAAAASTELESAKARVNALSEENQAMRSQLESLKVTSQSHDALTVEKQEMQRTIEYLQHSLRELEEESQRREEMARAEVQSMKKKWLDAVGRVDIMGQSVSEATQPLLHQISALREELRARQDGWKAAEAALLARIEDGNELRLVVEKEKTELELEVQALRSKVENLKSEMQSKQLELNREREKLDATLQEVRDLRGEVDTMRLQLNETKVKLDDETHAKQQLMARVNAERLKKLELAERSESTGANGDASSELAEAREREAELRMQLERSQAELSEAKALLESNGVSSRSRLRSSSSSRDASSREAVDSDAPGSSNGSLATQASILKSTLESPTDTTAFLSTNTTVLGLSQLQQRLRLAEGEKRTLKQQLAALETKQKQNTEDIVRLSTRNALLETKEAELHQARQELAQVKQRQQVLLELFGEKEEQVEELQSEVGELKAFYRKQLDTLASQKR